MQSKTELKKYIDDLNNTHSEFDNKSGMIHMRDNRRNNSRGFVRKNDISNQKPVVDISVNHNTRIPIMNYIQNTLMNNFRVRTAWDKLSKLYIVNYDVNNSDLSNNICKQSNGVIFEKNSNDVVCFIYNAIHEIDESVFYTHYLSDKLSDSHCSEFVGKTLKLKNTHNYNLDKINSQVDYKMLTIEDDELLTEEDIENGEISEIDASNISDFEKDLINDLMSDNFKNYTIQELYDGTLIKLFNYEGEWYTATNKCTDASRSRWLSDRSYDELFRDVNINYNSLNPDYCYAFILLHPENRMMCEYFKPAIVHVGSFDLKELCEINTGDFTEYDAMDLLGEDSDLINNTNNNESIIRNPKTVNFENITELLESFDTLNEKFTDNNYVFPGYFLVNNKTGDRIKIMNPKFKYLMNIKGNSRNMVYRICELMKIPNELEEFEYYFPEYSDDVKTAKTIVTKVGNYIYEEWKNNNNERKLKNILTDFDSFIKNTVEDTHDVSQDVLDGFVNEHFSPKNLLYFHNDIFKY